MSPRLSSRLAAGALAVSALALFGLTFTHWFAHEGLNGPKERLLRSSESLVLTLNGWELANDISAFVLLAVFSGIGAAVWCARWPRDPWVPAACGLAGVAAAVATWRVGLEIRAPDYELYNDVQLGARLALAAAIALVVAALLAAAQSLIGLRNREAHVYAPWRSIWPAVVGAFALYVLANLVNAAEFYRTRALVLCCAAALIGYAVPRWWLALVPILGAMVLFQLWPHYECNPEVADCSEEAAVFTAFGWGLVAVSMGAAVAIGIATRALQRRGAGQQQV